MIHVCFAQYDANGRYSKFTGTAMCSLFENHFSAPTLPSVTVHILHDNTLTKDNREKFIYLAGSYGQCVKFYNVDELCAAEIAEIRELFPTAAKTRYSIGMFYRFFIPQVLSPDIEKAIYLDSDTIVNLDISELWRVNLENKPLGAIDELHITSDPLHSAEDKYLVKNNLVAYEDYFNSGVLFLNLDYWRNNNDFVKEGFRFVAAHPEMTYIDQDILNYLFAKNHVRLPEKFDTFIDTARKNPQIRPAIYHYFGDTLQTDLDEPFNRLWLSHFVKTPWFDINIIDSFKNYVMKLGENNLDKIKKLSATLSGKTRAFVVTAEQSERVKKEFFVRDDEEIIVVEKNAMNQELIDKIKAERGKKIFFGFVSDFPEILKKAGLIEGEDFFNGFLFYPDVWYYFTLKNGYQIVKAM